jgi:hypothetical protein
MSVFTHRKPPSEHPNRNLLLTLRETLLRLEGEPVETQKIADLERILAARIAEIEHKTA